MVSELNKKAKIVAKKLVDPNSENCEFDELVKDNQLYDKLIEELSSEDNFIRRRSMVEKINVKYEVDKIVLKKRNLFKRLTPIAASIMIVVGTVYYFGELYNVPVNRNINFDMMSELKCDDSKDVVLFLDNSDKINITDSNHLIDNVAGVEVDVNNHAINYNNDVVSSISFVPRIHKLVTPKSKQYFITLEDGTKVWLNDNSELHYPTKFATQNREVTLIGEAYFEVTHDEKRPFTVKLDDESKVQVLGTSFNIKAYDDTIFQTTLITGKVSVTDNNQTVILSPSEQLTVRKNGEITLAVINTNDYTAWRDGLLVFNGEKLCDVLDVLSRCYNIEFDIVNDEFKDKKVVAKIKRFDDYNILLDMIEKSLNIKFVHENHKIVVKNL